MNTGNNLLYLLLGGMLGLIAVSSWLSEQAIRGLEVVRRAPRGITVGQDVRLVYTLPPEETGCPVWPSSSRRPASRSRLSSFA